MKNAITLFTALVLAASAFAQAPQEKPRRQELYGGSIYHEASRRKLMNPKASDNPQADGRDFMKNRRASPKPFTGTLRQIEHGLFKIDDKQVLLINVDFRDRGFVKEASAYLAQFEGKKAEAICQIDLASGPLVCNVFAMEGKAEVNLSEQLLQRGWYGWQAETGGAVGIEATRAANEAYWAYRGVWENPWYFPDGHVRQMYARIIVK